MTNENHGTLTLLEGFRKKWVNGVGGLDLLVQDERGLARIQTGLTPLATELVGLFQNMVEQRRLVREQHPYWFGSLLNFLVEPGVTVGEDSYSRFEIMQRAGFFPGRRFVEWANEQTGVKEKTWRAWMQVTRVYFQTEAGVELLESQDLTPDEWVEKVPVGKSIRAMSKVSTGTIQPHQVEALVDPIKTEPQLNHILRTAADQHEREEADRAKAEKEWVEGVGERKWLDWNPLDRRLLLKRVDEDGKYSEGLVGRFPDSSDADVIDYQGVMLTAAEAKMNEDGETAQSVEGELAELFVGKEERVNG